MKLEKERPASHDVLERGGFACGEGSTVGAQATLGTTSLLLAVPLFEVGVHILERVDVEVDHVAGRVVAELHVAEL